jgi:hypothetical protein
MGSSGVRLHDPVPRDYTLIAVTAERYDFSALIANGAIRREIFSARGTASHRGYRAQNSRNSIARIYLKTGALSG